ncbi:MAG: hypothetical protein AB7E12_13515 [Burkholderiaceae bacterium]
MFLQDHKQRQALEASIGEMDKEVEALRQFELKIEEVDQEIGLAQKSLEKIIEAQTKTREKIAALVNDPDMASKAILKLEEEGDAAAASIKRHQRALGLLRLRRRDLAIDYSERRVVAEEKWKSIAGKHADKVIAQEIEGLESLLDALAIKAMCLDRFDPLVNETGMTPEQVVETIVRKHIRSRLQGRRPDLTADPLLSKLKRVPAVRLSDIPKDLSWLGAKKARGVVQAERARLLGQAAA